MKVMIEQTMRSGSSGIAHNSGAPGKQEKSDLFANLMSTQDKQKTKQQDGSNAQAVVLHTQSELPIETKTGLMRKGDALAGVSENGKKQTAESGLIDKKTALEVSLPTASHKKSGSVNEAEEKKLIAEVLNKNMPATSAPQETGRAKGNQTLEQKKHAVKTALVTDHKPATGTEALVGNATLKQGLQLTTQTITTSINHGQQALIATGEQSSSGAQSGDKGNQDARTFQVIAADVRSSASSPSNNFQQYMSQKPTATMNVFDTMQHIAQSAKNGKTKLEIVLEPANLGKIHISLQTDASKQLQVHMIIDQSATRAVIDQQLPALRQALAQQGLDLSGFTMSSHGDQSSSGSQEHQGQSTLVHAEQLLESSAGQSDSQQRVTVLHHGSVSIHV